MVCLCGRQCASCPAADASLIDDGSSDLLIWQIFTPKSLHQDLKQPFRWKGQSPSTRTKRSWAWYKQGRIGFYSCDIMKCWCSCSSILNTTYSPGTSAGRDKICHNICIHKTIILNSSDRWKNAMLTLSRTSVEFVKMGGTHWGMLTFLCNKQAHRLPAGNSQF